MSAQDIQRICVKSFSGKRVRTLLVLGLIVLVVFGVKCILKEGRGRDFFIHKAGRAIVEGERIFHVGPSFEAVPGPDHFTFDEKGTRHFLYTPSSAIFAAPFGYLPAWLVATLWYILKMGMLVAMIYLLARIIHQAGFPLPRAPVLGLTFLILLRFFENDFQNRQINTVIVFFVIVSIFYFMSGKMFRGGLAIAFALLIKQPVLLFVAYMVLRRQWKFVAGCAVGLVLFMYIVPGVIVGFPRIHAQNVQWFNTIIYSPSGESMAQQAHTGDGVAKGESMVGLLSKYLTHDDASSHSDEPRYVNIVDLGPSSVRRIHLVFSALSVLVLALLTFRGSRSGHSGNWQTLIELGIVATLTLLISPVAHKAHFVMLLLPTFLCVYAYLQLFPKYRLTFGVLATVFVCFVLRNDLLTELGAVSIGTLAILLDVTRLHFLPFSPKHTSDILY